MGRFATDKKSKWGWEKLLEMWGRVILIQNQVWRAKIGMEVKDDRNII